MTPHHSRSTILKTPAARFEGLVDYPFESRYLEVEEGLNMHYVEQGGKARPVVLLLHGEPSWSYLYRHMIPVLEEEGFRVIAPDLIGFGKSDKFAAREAYSYARSVAWVETFIRKLDLDGILLFCQDWGGLIGLRLAADMPERFAMIVAANTVLPTGFEEVPEAFRRWLDFSQHTPDFDAGAILNTGSLKQLSAEEMAAYNAPFPSEDYQAAARIFPALVPIAKDDPEAAKNREAWKALSRWKKPFLTIFGDADPITGGAQELFISKIPGAVGQEHKILKAGHFIQEDQSRVLAALIADFYRKNTA